MILVGNVDYQIYVKLSPRKYMLTTATYCGGSAVDSNGHYIGGGIWSKGEHPNFLRLDGHKLHIYPVPRSGHTEYAYYDDEGKQFPKGHAKAREDRPAQDERTRRALQYYHERRKELPHDDPKEVWDYSYYLGRVDGELPAEIPACF